MTQVTQVKGLDKIPEAIRSNVRFGLEKALEKKKLGNVPIDFIQIEASLTGGNTGAAVLVGTYGEKGRSTKYTRVMKIAKRDVCKGELEGYQKTKGLQLDVFSRAELYPEDEFEISQENTVYGILLYQNVGSVAGTSIESLSKFVTRHIQNSNNHGLDFYKELTPVLVDVFQKLKKGLYLKINTIKNCDLSEKYGKKIKNSLDTIQNYRNEDHTIPDPSYFEKIFQQIKPYHEVEHIHGDLNPDNILLWENQNYHRIECKLIDFGEVIPKIQENYTPIFWDFSRLFGSLFLDFSENIIKDNSLSTKEKVDLALKEITGYLNEFLGKGTHHSKNVEFKSLIQIYFYTLSGFFTDKYSDLVIHNYLFYQDYLYCQIAYFIFFAKYKREPDFKKQLSIKLAVFFNEYMKNFNDQKFQSSLENLSNYDIQKVLTETQKQVHIIPDTKLVETEVTTPVQEKPPVVETPPKKEELSKPMSPNVQEKKDKPIFDKKLIGIAALVPLLGIGGYFVMNSKTKAPIIISNGSGQEKEQRTSMAISLDSLGTSLRNNKKLEDGSFIKEGETIKTEPESFLDLQMNQSDQDEMILIGLRENSEAFFISTPPKGFPDLSFYLNKGKAVFDFKKLKAGQVVKIVTPTLTTVVKEADKSGAKFTISIYSKEATFELERGSASIRTSNLERLKDLLTKNKWKDAEIKSSGLDKLLENWENDVQVIASNKDLASITQKQVDDQWNEAGLNSKFFPKTSSFVATNYTKPADTPSANTVSDPKDDSKSNVPTTPTITEDEKKQFKVEEKAVQKKFQFTVRKLTYQEMLKRKEEASELIFIDKKELEGLSETQIKELLKKKNLENESAILDRKKKIIGGHIGKIIFKTPQKFDNVEYKEIKGVIFKSDEKFYYIEPVNMGRVTVPKEVVDREE